MDSALVGHSKLFHHVLRREGCRTLVEDGAVMIEMFSGTIGSGKSYHALERIVQALQKGKHVIANFPLEFPPGMVRRGYADRFMFLDDHFLMGQTGVSVLLKLSKDMGWLESEKEGECLVVIDEATNYFPKEDATKPEQRLWRTFFTQSRKLGYDFILIVQDENSINKTIGKCIEYDIKHRKANHVFPFRLLPFTVFMYVTYWKQQRTRLKSESSIFVKRFAKMYAHKRLFADLGEKIEIDETVSIPAFGNCLPAKEVSGAIGRAPEGEGPDCAGELVPEAVKA